jgi:hypothetical protein
MSTERTVSRFVAVAALALAFSAPAHCYAQSSLSLGAAGGYGLLDVSGNVTGALSTVDGNVGVGGAGNASVTQLTTLGTVILDTNYSASYTGSYGSEVSQSLTAAANAVSLLSSQINGIVGSGTIPSNTLTLQQIGSGNNYTLAGAPSSTEVNVINLGNQFNGTANYTLTITGTSNEQFLFNIASSSDVSNLTVILNGVVGSNVFWNVGAFSSITTSELFGNVLTLTGTNTAVSLDSDVIVGSVVSNDSLLDMSGTVVSPELPTISMAGVAGLLVVVKSVHSRRRRRLAKVASLSN